MAGEASVNAQAATEYCETPASLEDGKKMRADAIAEARKLASQLSRTLDGPMRDWLKDELLKQQARLTSINAWLKNRHREMGSTTRPAKLAAVDGDQVLCACECGETVTPSRTATAFFYYCTTCGRNWQREAPRLPADPPKPKPIKCRCDRACRFCGGERRR